MFRIYKCKKDSTIYQNIPTKNAGADPILELIKLKSGDLIESDDFDLDYYTGSYSSRILLGFDQITYSSNNDYYLMLHAATISNMHADTISIDLIPINTNWVEGVGNKNDLPYISSGVSWNNAEEDVAWSNYLDEVNKISSNLIATDTSFLININQLISNLNVDYGFMVKYSDNHEFRYNDKLQFFSRNTHTIWEPYIIEYYSGSASGSYSPTNELDIYDADIKLLNFKNKYSVEEMIKIDIKPYNVYERVTYDTSEKLYILPETEYQIEDSLSGSAIIPWNSKNVVQTSNSGYFVKFNANSFNPGRYYKIKFKLKQNDEFVIIDSNHNFLIT